MKRAALCCIALLLLAASPAEETQHTVKEGETLKIPRDTAPPSFHFELRYQNQPIDPLTRLGPPAP